MKIESLQIRLYSPDRKCEEMLAVFFFSCRQEVVIWETLTALRSALHDAGPLSKPRPAQPGLYHRPTVPWTRLKHSNGVLKMSPFCILSYSMLESPVDLCWNGVAMNHGMSLLAPVIFGKTTQLQVAQVLHLKAVFSFSTLQFVFKLTDNVKVLG